MTVYDNGSVTFGPTDTISHLKVMNNLRINKVEEQKKGEETFLAYFRLYQN